MSKRLAILYPLFALSGFSGLVYESVWSHYLKLFVGHAAYAQTLVLAVFMGGMGLGAWLAERYGRRCRNLLWAYAAVEGLIGLSGLAFHGVFDRVTDWAYASVMPTWCAAQGVCAAQWLVAGALILPQSVMLGATFPLMTGGVLRLAPESPGRKLALLYFLNSLGAVAGVLGNGFVLVPTFGLPGSLLTAGLMNIGLAVAVYFVGKPASATPTAPAVASAVAGGAWPMPLLAVALLTGLSSFIYEVVWIRMLSMVLGSATHSFEIMLASFILGLALGALWIRRRIDQARHTLVMLAAAQLAMGAFALLTLPLYNQTFELMAWLMAGLARSQPGYALLTVAQTAIALVVMLPATFCAGMTLPLITYHLYRRGSGERAIGQVYAANTLGAIAGVLLTVHWLMPALGLAHAIAVGAAIDVALGIALLCPRQNRPSNAAAMAAVAALALLVAAPMTFRFDPMRMSASVFRLGRPVQDARSEIPFSVDGKTSTVHLVRHANGMASVSTNGKSDGAVQMVAGGPPASDETTMSLLGALPLAYKPKAAHVASIGFGTGMTSATLLGSPHLERLDTIEIEPAMVEAARYLQPVNALAFTDPRHRIVFDDARSYFSRGGLVYDVIVSEPSNPWVSGVASLFTEEFYARVRRHLKDDGLFVQWVQVYEITPELVGSVFAALKKTFAVFEVYVGAPGDLIIVAPASGQMPQRTDAPLAMPSVQAMLARSGLHSGDRVAMHRLGDQRTLLPLLAGPGSAANSDYFPIVDLSGAKARFLRADASELTRLNALETPVMRGLDGSAPIGYEGSPPEGGNVEERQLPYVRAKQWVAFMRDGSLPPRERSVLRDLDRVLHVRARLIGCRTSTSFEQSPWEGVVRFATETIPFLARDESAAMWRLVRESACARTASASQRQWIEMFDELASDRWEEAGALAEQLLVHGDTRGALQLVVLAQVATVAHLRGKRAAQAAEVLEAALRRLAPLERQAVWARLLSSQVAAAGATAMPAR
ncbi:MAG: spermidine synthase [Rubrivivax sp.]|nr:spermidine synthase [Rubrivivax sp.]NUP87271.1 spermidine synthase [Burkholderiaceae bacterium]